MALDNKISWYSMSDAAIVRELANYIRKERLDKNMTQNDLAEKTGLDRSTISQIENGRISTMMSFVQILRALDQLDILNVFQRKSQVSPMQMLKLEQAKRIRARKSNNNNNKEKSPW